ncbi:hypothetical protein QVD17_02939 [Tagetes erecta]|uniref:Uncharacterized protein n=1 Tax=Tagetes erecta TaxID=13708 RepID=A0AAD8LCJ9_TARER|nr:hypothetical protein QVD17_02939 [Tagetes erecta]
MRLPRLRIMADKYTTNVITTLPYFKGVPWVDILVEETISGTNYDAIVKIFYYQVSYQVYIPSFCTVRRKLRLWCIYNGSL